MAAKTQPRVVPSLLSSRQYSGTFSTALYNWPIFIGSLLFGISALVVSALTQLPLNWLFLIAGFLAFLLVINILIASFVAYDWGSKREYDRLLELANITEANVVIDVTAGKLRGTRGLLTRIEQGHYFVVDIYNAEKMPDHALRRARDLEPPLEAGRRIYRRTGKPDSLPIPHKWADVVYCSFSLHELRDAADRQAIFTEFARILKPGGKLLLAEHGRDWLNFAVFGPGVFGFYPATSWEEAIESSGLTLAQHEKWRGLIHLWVAEKQKT